VIRTRDEFDALWAEIQADPEYIPMVLGLFARDDIFNDTTEERIIALGLVDDSMAGTKDGRLILWGSRPGTLGFNPPTPAEMNMMALEILRRESERVGLPFLLISEVESADNLPNNANAIGTLRAGKYADDAIGVFIDFIEANPNTMVLVAADSDAGGMQIFSPPPQSGGRVTTSTGNPTGIGFNIGFPLDGIEGQNTAPFVAAPDAFGREIEFAIGWVGTNDVAGGIVSRGMGLNSELLRTEFSARFDNSDVYRMLYATLFGRLLPESVGVAAPDR